MQRFTQAHGHHGLDVPSSGMRSWTSKESFGNKKDVRGESCEAHDAKFLGKHCALKFHRNGGINQVWIENAQLVAQCLYSRFMEQS